MSPPAEAPHAVRWQRYVTPLASTGWVATVGLSAFSFATWVISGSSVSVTRFQFGGMALAAFAVLTITMASVGALVGTRRPRNPVGWLLLAGGVGYALSIAAAAYATLEMEPLLSERPDVVWAAWLSDVTQFGASGALGGLLLVFPDGRISVPGWDRWKRAYIGAIAVAWLVLLFREGGLYIFPQVSNPLAVLPPIGLIPVFGLASVGVILCMAGFITRVRRARGVVRLQLKWSVFAGLAWLAVAAAVTGLVELLPGMDALGEVPLTVYLLSSTLIPATIGIAILRHKLYDIDLIIRRTLIYSGLTLGLGALYGGLVLILQALLTPVTGEDALAVAASTLVVAALFRPARQRIQDIVDRRFYRSRHDAVRTIEAFGGRLREDVDIERLAADLCAVADEAMRPASVSVWLKPR